MRALLDTGAQVNVKHGDSGFTALAQAQRLPCIGTSRLLLEHGARLPADRPMPDDVTPRQWIERHLKGNDKAEMQALLGRAGSR